MDIVKNFKAALKIREVLLDNNVFQLHYRVTALMLLVCAGLVASKQHFGDPIDCITRDDVPNKIMDTYCWIHATFTLPGACNKTVGIEVAHPCVDKFNQGNEERVYHKYYQWVYFVLFFQAAFFYAPHFFWKSCEGSLLRSLTKDLRDPLFKGDDNFARARRVSKYLMRKRGEHQRYYQMFALFELANFLNVILQMYVVDEFLGGTFSSYGLDVIRYSQLEQDDRIDPMVRIFPRMTKCTFHRFGSSGDVQRHDALCLLPLNIINEKIYIMMWFWFVFLAIVTGLWLVYRALTFIKPRMRYQVLKRRANFASYYHLQYVLRRSSNTGDWFLLCMLCKNMDSQWFRHIVRGFSRRLKAEERRNRHLRNGYSQSNNSTARKNNNNSNSNKRRSSDANQLMLDNFDNKDHYRHQYDEPSEIDDQSDHQNSDFERSSGSDSDNDCDQNQDNNNKGAPPPPPPPPLPEVVVQDPASQKKA